MKNVKTAVQACKLLKSPLRKPWGGSKEILWIYYFYFPDEGGENKIYHFLSFSVCNWKFGLRQGSLSFYGPNKGGWGSWYRSNVSVLLAWVAVTKNYMKIRSYVNNEVVWTTSILILNILSYCFLCYVFFHGYSL